MALKLSNTNTNSDNLPDSLSDKSSDNLLNFKNCQDKDSHYFLKESERLKLIKTSSINYSYTGETKNLTEFEESKEGSKVELKVKLKSKNEILNKVLIKTKREHSLTDSDSFTFTKKPAETILSDIFFKEDPITSLENTDDFKNYGLHYKRFKLTQLKRKLFNTHFRI